MRAQSSMIMVLIVVVMFVAIAVFLLSLAGTARNDQFTSLYANNLLLSVMRTETGYKDPSCRLVSDLVFCAYFTEDWTCPGSSLKCPELANITVSKYMQIFGNETRSLRYLFTVSPTSLDLDPSGEPMSFDIGDLSLKKSKVRVVSHPLVISKTVNSNQHTLRIQLIVSDK